MSRFGDMLVYLRKRSGLSQVDLAEKLKMTRSAISMYETGRREPDLETLEVFADYFNVDMNTLTGNEKSAQMDGLTENQKILLEFARQVPDDKAEMILRVAKSILGDEQ